MPRQLDSPTDTYLDVLRTLGVTDAALRRHHDAGPETSLRVAIDADRGSPTADLLAALEATGRLLDLRDGLTPGDADQLTTALARFGLRIECAGSAGSDDPEHSDDELELRLSDDVTGATERISTAPDPESILATLREDLPDADAIAFAELLDGRHLLADARELDALAERYGPRIQPFDDPLLVPDAAIEVENREQSAEPAGVAPSADDRATPATESATSSTAETPTPATSSPTPATDDADESFGEFVSAVDDSAAEAVEEALSDGEPETHTIEGDGEDVAAASTASIGGGPRRTVSTSGIDDVFAQLESSAPADDDSSATTTTSTTTQTMSESSDPPTDPSASTDDATTTANGLTGGPTRTVSSKSVDDILEQATGDSDFETIAAEEGDADPDAVLADAEDVPPALEDADVAAELSPGESDGALGESDGTLEESEAATPDAEEPPATVREPAGAVDVPPADPAAANASSTEDPIAIAPTSESTDEPTEQIDARSEEAPATEDAADPDPATPMPSADDTDEDEQPSTLDDLLEDDVELRRGSKSADRPATPDARGANVDPNESADADGPLAAAGGVSPSDDASSDVESADAEESVETNDPGLVGRITSTIFGR